MLSTIDATVDLASASSQRWDVIVVGAGPAGAAAALTAAQRGASVLLLDKQQFPRAKVCGCCVNATALATIEALGARCNVESLGAKPIHSFQLAVGARAVRLAIDGGVAISRAALDAALVRRAIEVGSQFISGVLAKAATSRDGVRTVDVVSKDGSRDVLSASVIVAADGLAGRFAMTNSDMVARKSLMGAGVVLEHAASEYDPGVIFMASGQGGYAGAVQMEHGLTAVSAALNPKAVRACGGPAALVKRLFLEAGMNVPRNLDAATWKGTPLLTRRRRAVWGDRLLVVGDATGYVEPFTGEGIAWALTSGVAVGRLAAQHAVAWRESVGQEWENVHRALLRGRQRRCHLVAHALRCPLLMRAAVRSISVMPTLAAPLVRSITNPGAPRTRCGVQR